MNEFLERFRSEYPQYADLSDLDLARRLHQKFYSDMSWGDFSGRIGLQGPPTTLPDAQNRPQSYAERTPAQAFSPAVQNEREGMTASEQLRMGLQAIPLVGEFSDEVIGDTERVQDIRSRHPFATMLGEFIAGMAPIGLGISAARRAGPVAQAAVGAATGGAEGFIEGVGAGEGSATERMTGVPALVGGGLGTALGGGVGGVAGALTARQTRQGAPIRAAEALEETTGIRTRPTTRAFASEIEGQRRDLGQIYEALSGEFPEVNDPEILSFVNDLRGRQGFKYAVDQTIGQTETPSFDQLKDLRTRLTSMTSDEAQDAAAILTRQLDEYLEGAEAFTDNLLAQNFRQLRQRYARNAEAMDALTEGRRMAEKPAFEVEQALSDLTRRSDDVGAEQVREAFRAGQVSRVVEKLTRREDTAPALLRRMMEGGPGTSTYDELRNYFPQGPRGDFAMAEFRTFLNRERSAAEAARKFEQLIKRAVQAGAVIGGGLFGLNQLQGLLGGNQ